MADQCDACTFYRTRYYEAMPVGECRFYPPATQGQHMQWPEVKPDDWCGDFEAVGVGTDINGNAVLATQTLVKVMDVGGDPIYTVADLTACQLTNTANQGGVVFFYDGNDNTKLITQIGCSANQSVQNLFPQPLLAWSGEVWCALGQLISSMYVSVQGRKRKP